MKPHDGHFNLGAFLEAPQDHIRRIKASGQPEVIDIDGEAAVVMIDIDVYRKQLAAIDEIEVLAAIDRGIESMKNGGGRPAEEALADVESKFPLLKRR